MDSVRIDIEPNDEATLNVESTPNSLNVESHIVMIFIFLSNVFSIVV